MAQIQTKFIANGAITSVKLGSVTDGVTLDQIGSGSTIEVKTGGISNAQINSAAGIAYSKLNLSASIQNSDIASSAAIAVTKLAPLTVSQALVSNSSGFLTSSVTTSTELSYVSGVTSAIQTQLNSKQNSLTFSDSLVNNLGIVTLVGDSASPTASQYYGTNGSSALGYYNLPTPGTGTVTSVAFSDASTAPIYSISGSPVTASGTLTQTLSTQNANLVFAGPSSGNAAQPSFRSLVASDIPSLSSTYVTQSEVGMANGVASLDSSGKIPIGQLPGEVFIYQGTWDPTTNTPTLIDGTGTAGYVYWVSTAFAGTVVGLSNASMINFQVGDLVLYNGLQYELTTPAAGVSSVNGAQGAVTVNAINQLTSDVTAGPASGSQSVAATIAAIQGKAVSGTTGSGNVVFSASPTLIGTLVAAAANFSGAISASNLSGTNTGDQTITLTGNITGSGTGSFATTIASGVIVDSMVSASAAIQRSKLASGTAYNWVINDVSGVMSQTTVTANSAIASDSNGLPIASSTTAIELGYVHGVTSAIQNQLNALSASTPVDVKQTFILASGDITNQYIDLSNVANTGSILYAVQGAPAQIEGASYDYSISYTGGAGGNTRLTFLNGLATGGTSALVAGDVLQIQYRY